MKKTSKRVLVFLCVTKDMNYPTFEGFERSYRMGVIKGDPNRRSRMKVVAKKNRVESIAFSPKPVEG